MEGDYFREINTSLRNDEQAKHKTKRMNEEGEKHPETDANMESIHDRESVHGDKAHVVQGRRKERKRKLSTEKLRVSQEVNDEETNETLEKRLDGPRTVCSDSGPAHKMSCEIQNCMLPQSHDEDGPESAGTQSEAPNEELRQVDRTGERQPGESLTGRRTGQQNEQMNRTKKQKTCAYSL